MNKHESTLVYGPQGCGKSSFVQELLRRLLPEGTKARVATAEHYDAYEDAVKDGLVEIWRFNNRPNPFFVSRQATRGFWPVDTLDPSSPLVAPTLETFQKYPVRIFEGIATMAEYITSNHIEGGLLKRAGEGEIIGPVQEHIQFKDGDEGIGGLCWTHYRIGQREMVGLIQTSQKYAGHVIWTSHEDEGKDRGVPFIGPEVIGSKATGSIGREFDNIWHIIGVPIDVPVSESETRRIVDRRLYLRDHIYPGGQINCKSKNSVGLRGQAKVPDYVRIALKNGMPDLEAPDRLLKILRGEN